MSRMITCSIFFWLSIIGCVSFAQDTSTSLIWSFTARKPIITVAKINDVDANGFPDVLAGASDSTVYCLQGFGSAAGTTIWSFKTAGPVLSVAMINDVNNDGVADCLVGSADNQVYCLSGKPADVRVLWSKNLGGDVGVIKSIDDVNADGLQDCLIGTANGQILCLTGLGEVIWSKLNLGEIKTIEVTPDVNGDGLPDCFVGGRGKSLYCFSGAGKSGLPVIIMYKFVNADILSLAPIFDVDGFPDCVIGTSAKAVEYYQTSTGNSLWDFKDALGSVVSVAVVDDINEDGYQDVIAGSADKSVYALDGNDGTLIWFAVFGDEVLTVMGMPDVNKDGKMDIVVGTADNRIVCLSGGGDKAGKELWNYATSGDVGSLAVLPDVRGNGIAEVISGCADQQVRVLEGNAMILDVELTHFQAALQPEGVLLTWQTASETRNLGFEIQYSQDGRSYQTVAFIAGHGTTSSAHDYEFLHRFNNITDKINYRLKQLDSDGGVHYSSVLAVMAQAPQAFQLLGNYPNPFNSGTFIHYTLPEAGEVRIFLYNIAGETVYRWEPRIQSAGAFSVHWNGRTFSGEGAAGGVYFYAVRYKNEIKTGQLLLMK